MSAATWAYRMISPGTFEEITEQRVGTVDPGQVEVEFVAAGICGSDLPKFAAGPVGGQAPSGFPLHECVGVVRRAPHGVLEGQTVLALPVRDRGLRGHFAAAYDECIVLDGEWSADQESLAVATLIQPLATVLFGADRCEAVRGRTVAVVGTGAVGLLHGLVARARGAARVVGVDPRLVADDVAEFGFDAIVRDAADLPPDCADLCVEAVGGQDRTLADAVRLCRADGELLAFGVPPVDAVYRLPFERIFRKRLTLRSAVTPPWGDYLTHAESFAREHRGALTRLVSHVLPVSDAQQGFELAAGSEPYRRKVVLTAQ